jgi:hypothetical protein
MRPDRNARAASINGRCITERADAGRDLPDLFFRVGACVVGMRLDLVDRHKRIRVRHNIAPLAGARASTRHVSRHQVAAMGKNAALRTMRDLRTSFPLRIAGSRLRPVRLRRALSQHIVTDFRASRHLKWGHRAQVLQASKINRAKDLPVAQLSRVRKSSKRFRTKTAGKGICHRSPATYPIHAPQITRDVIHKRRGFD